MRCNNCNNELPEGAGFCGNCGSQTNLNQNVQPQPEQNKKSNKTLFIILGIILLVAVIVVVVIFIFNKKSKFEDPFEDIDNLTVTVNNSNYIKGLEEVVSLAELLETDLTNGELTKDEYVLQIAYSVFDNSKLDSKYKDAVSSFEPKDLFEKANLMLNDLSIDTFKFVFDKYTLNEIEWDVEDDEAISEVSLNGKFNYEITPLANSNNVSKLSNVVLSSNNNFLIYYTTEGVNAITDADAKKIADTLEGVVSSYKSKFNLDYKYSVLGGDSAECPLMGAKSKACKLLKKNNIDTKYLNSAMPVFIIDTDADNTGFLGYYLPYLSNFETSVTQVYIGICKVYPSFMDGCEDLIGLDSVMKNASTTYAFPYFVVSSSLDSFEDTKLVLAHELFHHYEKYICGNGEHGECSSGDFTDETLANYAASSVFTFSNSNGEINAHASNFSDEIHLSLDKNGEIADLLAYGSFVFAHNYAELVSNANQYLFNSMKESGGYAALTYLSNNSNGKYKDVLLTTAKRLLTLDYSNKALILTYRDKIVYPANYWDIGKTNNSKTLQINYSSMNYFYVNPSDYTEKSQLTFTGSSINLSLMLFVLENNSYKYLETYTLDKDFTINIKDFDAYQEIAFALVNSEISGSLSYSFELDTDGDKVPTVTTESLNLKSFEETVGDFSSFTCYQVEEDADYKDVYQIKVSFDKNNKISDMYFKGTIQLKNYNPDDPSFKIAQKVVSGLLYVMQKTYEEQFQYFKVITTEGEDKYSVTFKITKDFYEALNNSFELSSENKYEIVKELKSTGYTCSFE